jgi:hypothetical protein
LGLLVKVFITAPVLLFCTRRAYIIWNRSKIVLTICLSLDLASLVCWLVRCVLSPLPRMLGHQLTCSIAEGLEAPWGLGPLTDDDYYIWSGRIFAKIIKFRKTGLIAVCTQLGELTRPSCLSGVVRSSRQH